jgi:hypothetical protein
MKKIGLADTYIVSPVETLELGANTSLAIGQHMQGTVFQNKIMNNWYLGLMDCVMYAKQFQVSLLTMTILVAREFFLVVSV